MLAAVLLSVASGGCVEHALLEAYAPGDHPLATPDPAPPPTDGAIWRAGTPSGSFLYFDKKARGIGDLVTVVVLENLSAAGSANTTLENETRMGASLSSDIGFTDILQRGASFLLDLLGVDSTVSTVSSGSQLNVIDSSRISEFEGDGSTNRESSFQGVVTCRILQELPGGIYHLRGQRRIIVNHELQVVTLEGLVRRQDIALDNSVLSTQLADVKLAFDGIGVIDDKQRPPLLSRILDWAYPF